VSSKYSDSWRRSLFAVGVRCLHSTAHSITVMPCCVSSSQEASVKRHILTAVVLAGRLVRAKSQPSEQASSGA